MSDNQSGISRRTLAKGAAWAAPAVAMAAAAPMAAASQYVTFDFRNANKIPGNRCKPTYRKGYVLFFEVCNHTTGTVTVTFPSSVTMSLGGVSKTFSVYPNPMTLAPGCKTGFIGLEGQPSSQNTSLTGSFTYTWTSTNGLSGTGTVTANASSTPPIDSCSDVTTTSTANTAKQPAAPTQKTAPTTSTPEATTSTAPKAPTSTAPKAPASSAPATPTAEAPASVTTQG